MLLKLNKRDTMSNITAQNLIAHLILIHFSWETIHSFANATFIWSYFYPLCANGGTNCHTGLYCKVKYTS